MRDRFVWIFQVEVACYSFSGHVLKNLLLGKILQISEEIFENATNLNLRKKVDSSALTEQYNIVSA